jgi:SAM-dependent methyltransferase
MAIEISREPERFSEFERTGWDANIAGYDQALGSVAGQTVDPMLDAACVRQGTQVLDLCCGPGFLAAGAVRRGAEATGLDFSAAAVELARTRFPGCRFEQGDAQALPFPDASFDSVVCGYGLMHVPAPTVVLSEMRRVLRPGGHAAVSVWDADGVGFSLVYLAVRACGSMEVPLPHGPDFFQFGTPEKMRAALEETGFADIAARSFDQIWQVANMESYVAAILGGTVRARAVLSAQSAEAAAGIRAYIKEYLMRFSVPGTGFVLPMPAIIGSGVRSG